MTDPLAAVRRLAAAGRLSHAYLITGPRGPERQALARTLAQAMVCSGGGKPCGVCPHCKKVLAGIHPDVTALSFPEDKTEFVVDQIRALRSDAYVLPNEAGRKVYVIDPAGAMNDHAQNAFLKVLEEGPEYAAFLLCARSAGEVLPTVASRCEKLALDPGEGETPASDTARELARLLAGEEEGALLEFCIGLERDKTLNHAGLLRLLEETLPELSRLARTHPDRAGAILPRMELIQTLLDTGIFHVGVGHLLGWLCAGSREY